MMDSSNVILVDYEVIPKPNRALCTLEEFMGKRIVSESTPPSTTKVPYGGDKSHFSRANDIEARVDGNKINNFAG
jgi:hypothetical protein